MKRRYLNPTLLAGAESVRGTGFEFKPEHDRVNAGESIPLPLEIIPAGPPATILEFKPEDDKVGRLTEKQSPIAHGPQNSPADESPRNDASDTRRAAAPPASSLSRDAAALEEVVSTLVMILAASKNRAQLFRTFVEHVARELHAMDPVFHDSIGQLKGAVGESGNDPAPEPLKE